MSGQNRNFLKRFFPLIVALIAVAGVFIALSDTTREWLGLETHQFPGSRTKFDPVAAYDRVAGIAGSNVQLKSLKAKFVGSDGTLNLEADYKAQVQYYFIKGDKRTGQQARPVGTGGNDGDYLSIRLNMMKPYTMESYPGGGPERLTRYMTRMKTRISDPGKLAGRPRCSFADLWKKAIQAGRQKDAVAIIEYSASGYTFSILGQPGTLHFSPDCRLKKTRR